MVALGIRLSTSHLLGCGPFLDPANAPLTKIRQAKSVVEIPDCSNGMICVYHRREKARCCINKPHLPGQLAKEHQMPVHQKVLPSCFWSVEKAVESTSSNRFFI